MLVAWKSPLHYQAARGSCFASIPPATVLGSASHQGDVGGEDRGWLCPAVRPHVAGAPQASAAPSPADKQRARANASVTRLTYPLQLDNTNMTLHAHRLALHIAGVWGHINV